MFNNDGKNLILLFFRVLISSLPQNLIACAGEKAAAVKAAFDESTAELLSLIVPGWNGEEVTYET